MKTTLFYVAICAATAVMGCSERDLRSTSSTASTSIPALSEIAADKWLGRWLGPEGTFLQLAGGTGEYEITIQNLDGPRVFKGTAVGSGIVFERDGVKETIRATTGAETGMKWLAGKSDCLTVRSGEGYCKD